jgi:hypothetical protein
VLAESPELMLRPAFSKARLISFALAFEFAAGFLGCGFASASFTTVVLVLIL